jgi:glycosyltransferase involved in cell wall biosynthesis
MRGGEVTLEAILELVPDARLLTLVHVPGSVTPRIEAHRPRPSFVQHLPLARTRYRQYLPLFPAAVEQFDLDDVELVISTSHCAAKAVVPTGRARHLCYCFTPMRYAWDQFDAYFGPARVGALRSRLYGLALRRLARWDAATADRVDRYVAISRYVAGRIDRYYNRTADVIEPPVDTSFYSPDGSPPGDYFIIVSALVPYKRVDLAIDACRLAGVPLRVVGGGPEAGSLRRRAGPDVEFIEHCSRGELRGLYRGARAFLLTGEEDFGIAPVEAQACGRPVIALARGGARETVEHGVTGLLVSESTAEAFAAAIHSLADLEFDAAQLRRSASRFARPLFQERMRAAIETLADC